MRILKFQAKEVHDFLDFEVNFFEDLTLLTGTNGCGKTSIINSLIALINPSLKYLADLSFKYLQIEFDHDGSRQKIRAEKDRNRVFLIVSGIEKPFEYNIFEAPPDAPPYQQAELEEQYYGELSLKPDPSQVIQFINALPTPMFLGLDRRTALAPDRGRTRPLPSRLQARAQRNVFGGSLLQGLTRAIELAVSKNRDILIETGRLSENLRREFLLKLLTVEPSRGYSQLELPSRKDMSILKEMRRNLDTLPTVLQLPAEQVIPRVQPVLDLLERSASNLPHNLDLSEILRNTSKHESIMQYVFDWSMNRQQLSKIKSISDIVSKYNEKVTELVQKRDQYLQLLNQFFADNNKIIKYDERGFIFFEIDGVVGQKPIESVSSGEAQIFVILTHLAYNAAAQKANVFIIDEPELSLHVEWQEIFIESIRAANPNVQYIMATHSPSIILDKTDKCVDLSKMKISERRRG